MPKFPDPTKDYEGEPVKEEIDSKKVESEKFQPDQSQTQPDQPQQPEKDSSQKTFSPPPTPSPLRNIIPIILGILVFGGLIFAAVKFVIPRFTQKEPEKVTLTYWGLWEPKSVMQGVISDYEQENPHVTIYYTMQSKENYRSRLQNAVQQGQGPDIVRIHNTWLSMLKSSLAPAPQEVLPSDYLSSFYSVTQKDLTSGGQIYAVPLMIDGLALYYNPALTGKAPPTNWNELRRFAFNLTQKDPETEIIKKSGIALGTTGNIDHWSDILGLLLLQNSADPTKPSTQEVQDALTFYTIFSTQDGIWDETQPNSTQAFVTGSLAMMLGPSWKATQIQAANPELNFKIVKAPTISGVNTAWATYWAEAVTSSSQNPQEAWKFLKYLSSKETLQKLHKAQAQLRGYGEPYPRKSMANLLSDDPVLAPFVNQAPNYGSWYLSDRTFDEALNDETIKYYEDAVNAINQGSSPSSVTSTLSQGISQVLSKYPQAK